MAFQRESGNSLANELDLRNGPLGTKVVTVGLHRLILVKGAHVTDRARLILRYMGHCDHLSGSFRLHQVYRGWDLSGL